MKPVQITCVHDFALVIKEQRDELNMSHLEVDHRVGCPDGYCSKVEGFDRPWGKRPFNMTTNAAELLQGLGLMLVVMPVEEGRKIVRNQNDRPIRQTPRRGETAHKGEILTCQYRRRKI